MLPKKSRLTRKEVAEVIAHGRWQLVGGWRLKILTHTDPAYGNKYAVVVSKKIQKSSVLRHHMRRRVFEAVRKSALYTGKKTGYRWIVIYPDKTAVTAHIDEMSILLESAV
jgi:ribonuclease P protein component